MSVDKKAFAKFSFANAEGWFAVLDLGLISVSTYGGSADLHHPDLPDTGC